MTRSGPGTFTIEVVDPDDPAAERIVRAYMSDVAARWYGRPVTADELERALEDEPYDELRGSTGALVIAAEGGFTIGCAGVRFVDHTGELTKFFTRPDHRGRGVGSRLLADVERRCRARSIRTLRLDTRGALTEACALYERAGFERVDAFNDEPYSDRWYSKVVDHHAP